jgi:hypothetical protein
MSAIIVLQERIAALATDGVPFDRIVDEVIEPSSLDEDRKAALWLFASALQERGKGTRRTDVAEHRRRDD